MNGFERVMAALKGDPVDQIPIMLHNFMLAASEKHVSMGHFREDPQKIVSVFKHSVEKYQLDAVLVDIDTVTLAGSAGVPIDFPANEPARAKRSLLKALVDCRSLKPIQVENYRYIQIWLESVRQLKEYFGNEIFIRGNCDQAPFSLASYLRGTDHFMTDLLTEEEVLIHELLEYAADISCQFIRLMAQTGADMVSNGDSIAGPDLISSEMYEKFALPYEKKVIHEAHQAGVYYALHICGNTDSILDKMILSGADAFELDYKTDTQKAFDILHKEHTFIGNIDPSGVIALGTPELVVKKTTELLHIFRKTNRFILNAGCAIPPNTPEENIRAMIRTAREKF